MKKHLTAFGLLLACFSPAFAQDKICGTDHAVEEALKQNPALEETRQQLEEFTQNFTYDQPEADPKVIPVVVHIIHNYGSENTTKAQVLDAIRILNEDFSKQNSDTTDIIPEFTAIAANSEVEFRLAKIAPDGSCTDGITRTVSELTFNANNNVKDLISWPTDKYFNIWVVDNISFGAGGYAYYPGTAPQPSYEGVVVLHKQFGSIGSSHGTNFAARTLTHEAGHYLNLPHTWGSSNNVNQPNNCNMDDGVSDTPNCIGTPQSCDLGRTTCNSLDNVQNYMDYSNCTKMFTEGQKVRMQAALNNSAGNRDKLWQNSNLIATGTNDGFENPCAPIADFSTYNTLICQGENVDFTDLSYNADVDSTWTWNWTFVGGLPSSSTDQHPTVTYNTPGIFEVSLSVTNSEGTDIAVRSDYIEVRSTTPVLDAPVIEDMESPNFPTNTGQPEKSWPLETNSSTGWQKSSATGKNGTHSMYMDHTGIPQGERNAFISPSVDLSDVPANTANATFWVAYAKSSGSSNERLIVYVSKDCGKTWQVRFSKQGDALVTNGGGTVSGNFVPNQWQWRKETVNLIGYQGESNVLLKFETVSDEGDRVYVDDINIALYPTAIEETNPQALHATVYPNPNTGSFVLETARTGSYTLTVRNQLGQVVHRQPITGTQTAIHLQQPAGIYFWQLSQKQQLLQSGKVVVRE